MRAAMSVRRAAAGCALVAALTAAAAAQEPPLTLDAAVAEALRNSPELQPHADRLQAADIQRRLAASEFGVKFTPALRAGSDRFSGSTQSIDLSVSKRLPTGAQTFATVSSHSIGTAAAPVRDAGYSVGFSQPLLRGFGRTTTAALTDAARGVERARRELDAARARLIVDASTAYYTVVKQDRLAAIARQAAERATTLKQASEARAKAGLATQLDILRAELLEAQMAAAVESQIESAATAREALSMLLGRAPGAPLEIAAAGPARTDDPPPPLDALIASALSSRPELREARDGVGDARRSAQIAKWNLMPPVSLDVSYTRRGIGMPGGDALNGLVGGWRIGISSGFATDRASGRAAAESAELSVAAAERAARTAEYEVAAEVRRLYRAWEGAGKRIALQQQAVALAERQLKLAELRFERGLGSSLEVVDAQSSVLQSANALASAELDRAVLALDLRRAAGTLKP
jgi:outer membrane protein, multidrug efflux system